MTEELSGKSDELLRYQEEISSLLSQIVDLQHKLKEVRALPQPSSVLHCPGARRSAKCCLTCLSPVNCFALFFQYCPLLKYHKEL